MSKELTKVEEFSSKFKDLSFEDKSILLKQLNIEVEAERLAKEKERLKADLNKAIDEMKTISYHNFSYVPTLRKPLALDLLLPWFPW